MSKEYRPRLNLREWKLVQRYRKVKSLICKLTSKLKLDKICCKSCKNEK